MNALTEREIVELVDACGKRVCTTEQHHGCPYGDEGCTDCADRLQADYDKTIKRLLATGDENRAMQRKLDEALKYIPHSCECCSHQRSAGACALLPEGDEFSVDYTDGYDRDDCEHWELRIPTK